MGCKVITEIDLLDKTKLDMLNMQMLMILMRWTRSKIYETETFEARRDYI